MCGKLGPGKPACIKAFRGPLFGVRAVCFLIGYDPCLCLRNAVHTSFGATTGPLAEVTAEVSCAGSGEAPDKETYLYYSTQRPIDIGTYPNRLLSTALIRHGIYTYEARPASRRVRRSRAWASQSIYAHTRCHGTGRMRTMSSGPPAITWIFGGRWMPRPRWWENGRTLTASRIKSG